MKLPKFTLLIITMLALLTVSANLVDPPITEAATKQSTQNQGGVVEQIHIVVDDTALETPGRLQNGRTMVPLRGVFEQVGASVNWDSEEEIITIIKDWDRLELSPGTKKAEKNYDEIIKLEEAPFTSRGTTWLPLRAIGELFDLDVDWVSEHDLVRISTGEQEKDIGKIAEDLKPIETDQSGKVVYLTFDDGPSHITPEVLDILDEYNARATFFVIGQQAEAMPHIIRRIHNEGHLIANHSYTHDYDKVYDSPESFEEELLKTEEVIKDITGKRTTIFRPPGGEHPNMTDEKREILQEHGYTLYNWSVSAGDTATPTPSSEVIKNNVLGGVRGSNGAVVLMHDSASRENTKKALSEILRELSFEGYSFPTLPQ
ncbi:polysaccharide deacetylase family protein [Natranaerobius thermophilus]|uniref:Polysaccharide deacetylase n=1 Tax=Natranaerobius thermophilus (strain ATCC BAA-1301 / DSM 18059 / JW/NM-WN-LF) TaxID=457570 RepID=B2A8I0_NATTJ|nr:polysaccharide deacetylase family protein [Natranaerobius thermophilus]ACB85864.1 polysaccharide deacetylase [Natranaerobius thermophilus JW/NM-WN-LF]